MPNMKQEVKQTVIVKIGDTKKKKGKGKKKKTKQARAPLDPQAIFNYRPIVSVPPATYGGFSGPNNGPTYGQQYDQLNKKIDLLQDMFNQTNTRTLTAVPVPTASLIDLSDEASVPASDQSFEFISAPSPPEPSPPPRQPKVSPLGQRIRMENDSSRSGDVDDPFTFDTPPEPERRRLPLLQDSGTNFMFSYDGLPDYVDPSPDRFVPFGNYQQPTPSPEPNQGGLLTPELLTNQTPQGFAGSGTFDASREASGRRRRDPLTERESMPVRNLNFRNSAALDVFNETIPPSQQSNAESQINPLSEDLGTQTDIFEPPLKTPVKRSPSVSKTESFYNDDTPTPSPMALPNVQRIKSESISYREVKSVYDGLSSKKKKEYLSEIRSELGKPAGDKSTLRKLVTEIESALTEDMPGPSTNYSPIVVESNPIFDSVESPVRKRKVMFSSAKTPVEKKEVMFSSAEAPVEKRKVKASDIMIIKTQKAPMDMQRGRSLPPGIEVDAKGMKIGKQPKK